MKKKLVLSAAFVISLMPMLLNQYGGAKGVQEITGLINLLNPIGLASVILFAAGVWLPFKSETVGRYVGLFGAIGIIVSELYKFFTWHVLTITGEMSLQSSVRFAFPEFYAGLIVSVAMVIFYVIAEKKLNGVPSAGQG